MNFALNKKKEEIEIRIRLSFIFDNIPIKCRHDLFSYKSILKISGKIKYLNYKVTCKYSLEILHQFGRRT